MINWQTYWQEALDYYQKGDYRFFPGDSDDIWTFWPGREDDMRNYYFPEAKRHFLTLQANTYPEHRLEVQILMELGLAHANMPLNTLDLKQLATKNAANEEEFSPLPTPQML